MLVKDIVEVLQRKQHWHHGQGGSIDAAKKRRQFLMEAFIAAKYSAKDLAMLNQCRTFLKAVTLADISTANGRQLLPGITDGTRKALQCHSSDGPGNQRNWGLHIGDCGNKP